MTREELKEAMPILTAFVKGKTIQCYDHNTGKWKDEAEQLHTADLFVWPSDFRIKPEPEYRPFKDADECWQEMLNHQPFGWVKTDSGYEPIWHVNECDDFNATFKNSTFADGTPFGVKE